MINFNYRKLWYPMPSSSVNTQTKKKAEWVCFHFPEVPCREYKSPSWCSILLWSKSPLNTETRDDQLYNPFSWRVLGVTIGTTAAVTAASSLILQSFQRTKRIIVCLCLPLFSGSYSGIILPSEWRICMPDPHPISQNIFGRLLLGC